MRAYGSSEAGAIGSTEEHPRARSLPGACTRPEAMVRRSWGRPPARRAREHEELHLAFTCATAVVPPLHRNDGAVRRVWRRRPESEPAWWRGERHGRWGRGQRLGDGRTRRWWLQHCSAGNGMPRNAATGELRRKPAALRAEWTHVRVRRRPGSLVQRFLRLRSRLLDRHGDAGGLVPDRANDSRRLSRDVRRRTAGKLLHLGWTRVRVPGGALCMRTAERGSADRRRDPDESLDVRGTGRRVPLASAAPRDGVLDFGDVLLWGVHVSAGRG
jgi:hypothetical protein